MIKLRKEIFKNDCPFYPAFVAALDQSWGGKSDSDLQPIAKTIQLAYKDVQELRSKYLKSLGVLNEDGEYSMDGATKENKIEFNESMRAVLDSEFEIPAESVIELVKRKKTILTPFQAAAVSDVIRIVWPTDDGSDLDKVEKK